MKVAQPKWDDIRFVLAVADHGSVASAARLLDVNHATVLRRIAAFEAQHGLRVFERTKHGYQLLADRRALIEAMRDAGAALGAVEKMIDSERPQLGQGIRITSTDALCLTVLPPIVSFLSKQMSLPIDMLSGNSHLDFNRLQADITVRPALALPDELKGTKAAMFRFGIYKSHDCKTDKWLGLTGALSRSGAATWMMQNVTQKDFSMTGDSFLTLAGLAEAGKGRVILPVFLGRSRDRLLRVDLKENTPTVPLWVASHRDLAASSRLSKARKLLSEKLKEIEPDLLG